MSVFRIDLSCLPDRSWNREGRTHVGNVEGVAAWRSVIGTVAVAAIAVSTAATWSTAVTAAWAGARACTDPITAGVPATAVAVALGRAAGDGNETDQVVLWDGSGNNGRGQEEGEEDGFELHLVFVSVW